MTLPSRDFCSVNLYLLMGKVKHNNVTFPCHHASMSRLLLFWHWQCGIVSLPYVEPFCPDYEAKRAKDGRGREATPFSSQTWARLVAACLAAWLRI